MKIEIDTELKPCPFCGGKAEMHYYGSNGRRIKCVSCLIGIRQAVRVLSIEWLEKKIIEDWNKRI